MGDIQNVLPAASLCLLRCGRKQLDIETGNRYWEGGENGKRREILDRDSANKKEV